MRVQSFKTTISLCLPFNYFLVLYCEIHLSLLPEIIKSDKFRSQDWGLSPSFMVMHQLYVLPSFPKHPSSSSATGPQDVIAALES